MKPKVFISSTFLDLIPYREKLWEILLNLDVTILGMEKFGARSSSPLITCLKEVTKCDVYIGIISYRYGSVDRTSKKSFTQLEYERADECNKEILIYLFDDFGIIQPRFIDFGSKSNKLIKFKKILRTKHTIDTFSDPDDLSTKVNSKLHDLLPRLPQIFIRPVNLDALLHRFKIGKEDWIAFVGHLDNTPLEIFTGIADEEMFPIPFSITKGRITLETDPNGDKRYSFKYTDNYGFVNSLGGLEHKFDKNMHQYSIMITKLLIDNTPLHTIFKVIDEMNLNHLGKTKDWKKGVKEALSLL